MFKQAAAIRVDFIHSFFRRTALLLPIMLLGAGAYAQSPTDGTTPSGLTPGAPAGSYALSGFDNVNLYNGNLNFHLPLISIGGRGKAGYTMMQTIDSKRWVVHSDSETSLHWADYNWWTGFKPGLSPGVMNVRTVGAHPISCPEFGLSAWYTNTLTRLTFTTADGTEYEFRDALTNGAVNVSNFCSPNNLQALRRGTVWVTGDGSSASFISDYELYDNPFNAVDGPVLLANGSPAPISGFLLLRDGTRYRIDNYTVSWIRDSNGNKVTLAPGIHTGAGTITDPLNRSVNLATDGNGNTTITFNGFLGATRQIKIWRAPLSQLLRSDFPLPVRTTRQLFQALSGSPNTPFDPSLVSAVELPDGRKYEFRYNYYGELAKVILPTGGSFEYEWEPGPGADADGVVWNTVSYIDRTAHYISIYRRVKEKRVYSGGTTWENKTVFTASHPGYTSPRPWTTTVKVVQKDANDIFLSGNRHYFYGSPTGSFVSYPFDYSEWDDGKEYRTEALANDLPTPSLLRSGDMSWQNAPGAPNILNWHPFARKAPPNNPRNVETVTTLMDVSPNQVSKQKYFYDEFNNRTAVEEFDYGTNTAPSFPTRRNEIDYVRTGESNGINYIGTGVHLRSLPQEQRIYSINPSDGTKIEPPIAKTHFYYDQYALVNRPGMVGYEAPATAARGNLTSTSHWLNTNNTWITTTQKYDIAGNAFESTDGRGNTSEVVYSGAFNAYAFPSISRTPVPDPTGQHGSTSRLETTYDYDYYSGLLKSTTDPNLKTTTYSYNDLLDRLTTIVRPAGGGQTAYFYGDTPGNLYLLTQTTQSATQTLEGYQYFDGLGRGVRTVQTEAGNSITVETKYDGLGRAFQVSNPYRAGDTVYWTTNGYDALGRVTIVTTPDSAVVTTTYSNNVTTVRDQANKQRRSTTDALGRLVKVEEMYEHPSTSVYATTTYSYDLQDNLTRVTQGQSPQVQTRTFDYDSLKRLRSAVNPESWTVTYSYDNNGNLEQKVDSRPVTVIYSYDALNRVKTRTYSDGTPGVAYIYDASTVLNAKGRLTSVSSSVSTYSYDEYDALGRVIRSKQTTDAMAYQMSYEYDLAGNMTSQTYPSGRKITTGYDTAGRISQVSGQKTGEPNRTYASLFAYAAHGAIREMKLGNGRWEHTLFNNRLQPTEIGLGTSGTDSTILKLAYGYGTTNNNGNVLSQQITINSSTTISQSYGYDQVNRLSSATESGSWQQNYWYDRYGNRWVSGYILNSQLTPQSEGAYDAANNRLSASLYDGAGNQTRWMAHQDTEASHRRMI